MQFIVRDLANNMVILPEDGAFLKITLETFNKASHKNTWMHSSDIMQFKSWRELQTATIDWENKNSDVSSIATSQKQWVKIAKQGANKIVDITLPSKNGQKHYTVIEITTPEAATVYGRGTQWCTSCSLYAEITPQNLDETYNSLDRTNKRLSGDLKSNPWNLSKDEFIEIVKTLNNGDLNTNPLKVPNPYYANALENARKFLKNGSLFIIYKDDKPYMQIEGNAAQLQSVQNIPLYLIKPITAIVFRKMIQTGRLRKELIDTLESHIVSSGLLEMEAKGLVPKY
jgi:hypothetical protein